MAEKSFDFAISGNCTTNQVWTFDELPTKGRTSMATNPDAGEILYGGCAFNVFYAMIKLGLRVKPVFRYSDPVFKDKIYDICNEYNLPTDYIYEPQIRSYNRCILLQDKELRHSTVIYRFGEDSDKGSLYDRPMEVIPEHFEDIKMYMMIMGNPMNSYRILEQIKQHDLEFAFSYKNDPRLLPKELLDAILPKAKIIFTNDEEERYLSKLYGWGHITDIFSEGKAEIIVTTLGSRGSKVYSKTVDGVSSVMVPATRCENPIVDTVGAGDGYIAGFMYGYMKGLSLECCAQYGSTVSSFVIEKRGSTTNLPNLSELLERNNKRPDARRD